MLDTLISIASLVGTTANAGNAVLELVDRSKRLLSTPQASNYLVQESLQARTRWTFPTMQPFQPHFMDPFNGGAQWLPMLQNLAAQNGNPWVPPCTQGLIDVHLTGVWVHPLSPPDRTYIRQFGTYVNLIAGVGGIPTGYGEGLFDPINFVVHLVGRNLFGNPIEMRLQLLPNWVLQGFLVTFGPVQAVPVPIGMVKAA